MSWAVQVLGPLRAFLTPLYAFLKGHGAHKDAEHKIRTPPAVVRFCAQCLQHQLARTPAQLAEFRKRIPGTAATDAGATKTHAGVGGWHDPT